MRGCEDMGIVISNVSKSFNGKKVLDRFSASLEYGKTLCIMGESGSGKTTLINILAGITDKDSGVISGISDKKISMVFQEDRLVENLTVYRNIRIASGKSITKESVENELEKIGLDKKTAFQKISLLSGGMKRRIAILRAVMAEYDILLLDEPFKGLDDVNKSAVIKYVKEKSAGKTIIMITHDNDEAKAMTDNIIYI